jgi:hypothetical protein
MNDLSRQRISRWIAIVAALGGLSGWHTALAASDEAQSFQKLEQREWREVFSDSCTGDWMKNWFLDGDQAVVSAGENGMTIDATGGYAVLWTQQSFEDDVRIEYDFQRLDSHNKGVNILYIQAVGDGEDGHDKDITRWSQERADAAMSDYYNNMHTYHISYAAYGWTDGKEYVRGRRYMPLAGKGLKGTELAGSYEDTGLFDEPGPWIHVTVIKTPRDLLVRFVHPEKTLVCHFKNEDKPPIDGGRIGLRLMPRRKSLIKNFRVSSHGE